MKKIFLILMPTICLTGFWLTQCGKKTEIRELAPVEPDKPEEPKQILCDGEKEPGEFRELSCAEGLEGNKIEVCDSKGKWILAVDNCEKVSCKENGGDLVTFESIKPILDAACVQCHYTPENITDYAIASKWADDIYRRIRLPADNIQFMPFQKNPLKTEEIKLIRQWIDDGKPEKDECPGEQAYLDLDYIETNMLAYLADIDKEDREFVRFLVSAHKFNLKQDNDESYKAMNKTLNSLSFENLIHNCNFIDEKKTVCGYDYRSFEQDYYDWQLIEINDPVNFVSNTVKSALIRDLTKTEKPWFHYDVYIDITLGNPAVYYEIMNVPNNYVHFLKQFEIDYIQGLTDNEFVFAGFNGSPISLRKNRMIYRMDSQINGIEGACWSTADPQEVIAESNLFEFPFISNLQNSHNIFQFAAGETICHLPNNLFIYALFNAQGIRADEAPVDVVTDIEGLDPIIENPIDCHRCHNAGFIPAQDQVRDIALLNAKFNQDEKDVIRQIYKNNGELSAYFQRDNSQFSQALGEIGVSLGDKDPINKSYDFYRTDQSLEQVAAFVFLPVNEMISCIEESALVKNQIGQLLNGARITHDQLLLTLPVLFQECNDILNDPLGR